MASKTKSKTNARRRRHARVRKKVFGSAERPRLAVFRSNKHITAQVINDYTGETLATASTYEADLRDVGVTVETAKKVGELVADRAKAAGVEKVTFDRGGYRYHGRVAALAEAARETGLEF